MSSRKDRDEASSPRAGVIIAAIVGALVVILVIILVVWFSNRRKRADCATDADCAAGKKCINKKCQAVVGPPCTLPPTPVNVEVNYDRIAKSAVVTWNSAPGATSYKVYRKVNSQDVTPLNADETRSSPDTVENFSGLVAGTHYFVVASVNACGQSSISSPVVFAPACTSVPTTPSAPMIVTNVDQCAGPQGCESVQITVDEATGVRPINIIEGNGQIGVDSYFVAFEAPLSPMDANLACTGNPVGFTVTHVSLAEEATLIAPTSAMTLGPMLLVKWQPIPTAEEYSVTLVAVDSNGVDIFIGGRTTSPTTELAVTTPNGALLSYAIVYGYKICNMSNVSPVGFHIPPPI